MSGVSAAKLAELTGSWRAVKPAYQGLADAVRMLVLDGRLPPGTRLPSERELARALATSRTTVTAAYARLRDGGFLTGRRGAASRTAMPHRQSRAPREPSGSSSSGPVSRPIYPRPLTTLTPGVLDFTCAAMPAPPGVTSAVQRAALALPEYLHEPGYHEVGIRPLREVIARRYEARGLPTSPDQIIVVSGALEGFSVALQAFAGLGDRVLVDHPTYPNALHAIQRTGTRPIPVPLSTDGWDLPMLDATLRQAAPRLAYLIVDFHNPTGLLMDESSRAHVARSLARTHTVAVVDESLVELALDVPVPPPLAAFAKQGSILLLGSLSKPYWGGLAVGWIRAPHDLVPALLAARADLGTSVVAQLTAAELLADGSFVPSERLDEIRSRRTALTSALTEHLPTWRFAMPRGGLSLWCELPEPVSSALTVVAERHGVLLAAGPKFGLDGAFERFVRLPFTMPEEELRTAVVRLADAYASTDTGSARVRRRSHAVL